MYLAQTNNMTMILLSNSSLLFSLLNIPISQAWCAERRLITITHGRIDANAMMRALPNDNASSDDASDNFEQTTSSDEESSIWFGNDKSKPLTPAQKSLQRYVESIKAELNKEGHFTSNGEGVNCVGEPSVDPSRQVQSQGDSEWMDDW